MSCYVCLKLPWRCAWGPRTDPPLTCKVCGVKVVINQEEGPVRTSWHVSTDCFNRRLWQKRNWIWDGWKSASHIRKMTCSLSVIRVLWLGGWTEMILMLCIRCSLGSAHEDLSISSFLFQTAVDIDPALRPGLHLYAPVRRAWSSSAPPSLSQLPVPMQLGC